MKEEEQLEQVERLRDWIPYPEWFTNLAEDMPWVYTAAAVILLFIVTYLSQLITKHVLMRMVNSVLKRTELGADPGIGLTTVVGRFAQVVPAMVLAAGIYLVPDIPETLIAVVGNVCTAYIILTIARAFGAGCRSVSEIYNRRKQPHDRPIKGYMQVVQIVIYVIAAILIVASLIDKSPIILLSGLGAMGAVLMLVFQDTILSFVASLQVSSNDLVRVGDWIQMPNLNADGEVTDMALHTITVRNWDKTITTVPTKRLLSESFINFRGMEESGGRRIARALYLDQSSMKFLDQDDQDRLSKMSLLKDYIKDKRDELDDWNKQLEDKGLDAINSRQLTNLGTFRSYILNYLKNHPGVHQDMTLMVRQLAPSPSGVPLEVYCFTNTVKWGEYEQIQSDIFDHLLAIAPYFDLRVFQAPSGNDIQAGIQAAASQSSSEASGQTHKQHDEDDHDEVPQ